jgi:hypothetical protein
LASFVAETFTSRTVVSAAAPMGSARPQAEEDVGCTSLAHTSELVRTPDDVSATRALTAASQPASSPAPVPVR